MDELIKNAGEFGRFQKISVIILGTISILPAMSFYVTLFNTAESELKCDSVQSANEQHDLCDMWNNYSLSLTNNQTIHYSCQFDDKYYGQTIINDWQLVCDKQYLAGLTQSFYLCGFISSFVSGILSDKYGRKRITSLSVALYLMSSLAFNVLMIDFGSFEFSITAKIWIYNIYQLLSGILYNCIYNSAYVLLIELTTDKYHTLVSNVFIIFFIGGEFLIMAAYYFSKNWKFANIFISVYTALALIPFVLILPESPRFL